MMVMTSPKICLDVVVVLLGFEKCNDGDAQVHLPTSKIQYVRHAFDTFVAWPTHLVKLVSHEVIFILFNMD